MKDIAGKRVLVTGSSTGIGAAVASGFAEHGAAVAIHYNSSRPQAEALAASIAADGGRAVLVAGDVSTSAEAKRIVRRSGGCAWRTRHADQQCRRDGAAATHGGDRRYDLRPGDGSQRPFGDHGLPRRPAAHGEEWPRQHHQHQLHRRPHRRGGRRRASIPPPRLLSAASRATWRASLPTGTSGSTQWHRARS